MDKETLSHYGWIVILTLILAVMLAFASPFGNFVANGVKAFTAGFVDTNNEALSDEYIQNIQDEWEEQLNDCAHEFTRLANQKAATCQSAGYTGDKVCNGCGKTMETGTVTAKLDHTPVTDNAVPATCEQEGKTEGSHCSSCNTVLVTQTTTDALGHDWGDPYVATEATCLGNGISRIECKREGCNAHSDSTIKAEGHTIVTVNGKAATCTTTGLTNGEKCSVCGIVTKAQTTIKALGHTEVNDSAIQASCEVAGKTAGVHCSVCNTVIKAQETVPALGHNMGTPVTTLTATCTTEGQTKTSCTRTGCGYYKVGTITATGHTEVTDKAVAATCTTTGLTAGKHCSVCNTVLTAQTTTATLGHSYGTATYTWTGTTACKASRTCSRCSNVESQNGTITNAVTTAAKCTTTGVRTYTAKFSNNAFATQTKTASIAATGHTEVTDKAVAATCTATGLTAGKHCSVCGEILTAQATVKALGHNYTTVTTAATCTTEGSVITTCQRCGDSSAESISALGHITMLENKLEPSCTTEGYSGDTVCTRCNEIVVPGTVIQTTAHAYNEVVTPATNFTQGYTIYTCTNCGESYIDNYTAALCPLYFNEKYYINISGMDMYYIFQKDGSAEVSIYNGESLIHSETCEAGTFEYEGTNIIDPSTGEVEGIISDDGTQINMGGTSNLELAATAAKGFTVTAENREKVGYTEDITNLVIPEKFYDETEGVWYKVVAIYSSAFEDCTNLQSVTLPSSVTSIGQKAFRNCTNLEEITIPDTTWNIADYAFYGCSKLKTITLPNSLTSISQHTFSYCTSLKTIVIPDSVTFIGSYAFTRCSSLSEVTLGTGLTKISIDAFSHCTALTEITIPQNVKEILFFAFNGCSRLSKVTFESQDGWYVTTELNATSGTDVNVEDALTNADLFTSTYYQYHWYKS